MVMSEICHQASLLHICPLSQVHENSLHLLKSLKSTLGMIKKYFRYDDLAVTDSTCKAGLGLCNQTNKNICFPVLTRFEVNFSKLIQETTTIACSRTPMRPLASIRKGPHYSFPTLENANGRL